MTRSDMVKPLLLTYYVPATREKEPDAGNYEASASSGWSELIEPSAAGSVIGHIAGNLKD